MIVLFNGEGTYGSVGAMVPGLADGFAALGLDPVIIDLTNPGHERRFHEIAEGAAADAIICVSGFGLPDRPDSPAIEVFNRSGASVVGVFLDHPFCLRDRIDLPLDGYQASFPAGHAANFVGQFIRDDLACHHLPHGAVRRADLPWAERALPLVLVASLFLPPEAQRRAWRDYGRDVETRLNEIADIAGRDLARPLEAAVLDVIGDDAGFEDLFPYMKTVDDYLRNWQRVACVEALAAFPLTVVGQGWETYAEKFPGVRFAGEQPISEAMAAIDRAKAVLNPFPGYNGSHERVVNAMAGGAAALTSRSDYYADAFGASEIIYLDDADPAAGVAALLADDARLEAVASNGRARMLVEHTWERRAERIADFAGLGA